MSWISSVILLFQCVSSSNQIKKVLSYCSADFISFSLLNKSSSDNIPPLNYGVFVLIFQSLSFFTFSNFYQMIWFQSFSFGSKRNFEQVEVWHGIDDFFQLKDQIERHPSFPDLGITFKPFLRTSFWQCE